MRYQLKTGQDCPFTFNFFTFKSVTYKGNEKFEIWTQAGVDTVGAVTYII